MRQTALRPTLVVTFVLTMYSGTLFAADPQLMNLVMPGAQVLAGVNVTSAKISPFGQFIISKLNPNGGSQKLPATTGFNPLQDVSEILMASAAASSTPPSVLLMALGTFPVDKFAAMLSGNSKAQVQSLGGATLIAVTDAKTNATHAVAFIGNTIAIAGDLDSVKAAIARSTGANAIDPALAVRANQLSSNEDEWIVSAAAVASLLPPKAAGIAQNKSAAQVLPLLKNIQSFSGGVKLGDVAAGNMVTITGEAVSNSAQNAAALQAVLQLGASLATNAASNTAKNPQMGELLQLLGGLQVSANGSAVDVSLSIPETQLENLVNSIAPRTRALVSAPLPVR